ncbi:hypothetical protein E0198_000773 [Clavispora lusitaniae]|nr:hypothetical protein E0198_000773 [Clavispora lusitaniae]
MARTEDLSDNEVDAFAASKEKVLLDEAGEYMNGSDDSEVDSEEEVMGLKYQNPQDSEDDDEEDGSEDDEEGEEEDDDDEEKGWGSKRNYYGGDDIDEDDETAKEMAEEALRQQKKHLRELEMDDFVDEEMMEDWKKSAEQYDTNDVKASVPVVSEENIDLSSLDDDEKLKYLNGSFPEFVPLLKEFNSLSPVLSQLEAKANPIVSAKFTALSSYMSSIASYFSLFAENVRSNNHFSMKSHPVMESILSAREVWRQAKELNSAEEHVAEDSEAEAEAEDVVMNSEDEQVAESESEQEQIQTDSEDESESEEEKADDSDKEVNIDVNVKRTIRKRPENVVSGDFTETATPDQVDKEEKERRKKSLRFYTSKIDQAAKKDSRNEKFTGDLDLPYKERLFERQQRLIEEARKRGLGMDKAQLGDDLDGQDVASDDEKAAQKINEDAGEYYESFKQAKMEKKDARRAAHEKAKKAAREGKLAELQENVDDEGKRALNFQILKNKGLTPNRRNENRNARVKKRKKYEQAKKKLKSVRQVYDESNRGPYEGEKTGIKKGVSRSVKLV